MKNEPKGFYEVNYPVEIKVRVIFPKSDFAPEDSFEDGMNGLNVGHALWRAQQNWADANIELL